MATAEVNFEMDERLWWQVRKHAQHEGMSIGEMTIKALGQYMVDHPIRSATGQTSTATTPTSAPTSLPRVEAQRTTSQPDPVSAAASATAAAARASTNQRTSEIRLSERAEHPEVASAFSS